MKLTAEQIKILWIVVNNAMNCIQTIAEDTVAQDSVKLTYTEERYAIKDFEMSLYDLNMTLCDCSLALYEMLRAAEEGERNDKESAREASQA